MSRDILIQKSKERKQEVLSLKEKMALEKEDWRLCVDWFVQCSIIQPDHKVNTPQAQVFDLATVLRDGVLLCHLLNQLHSGAIDLKDFSQRPQMSQVINLSAHCLHTRIITWIKVC